jgi:hypothetical protein
MSAHNLAFKAQVRKTKQKKTQKQHVPSFVAVLGHQGPTIQSQSNTHPSHTVATSAAISRTTTATFCEAVKLPEITFQRKTHSNQFAASEKYRKDKSGA